MIDQQFFTGMVISQKPKTDRSGRDYWGVTVKVAKDVLVWFGQDRPLIGPEGGAGMTVTGLGEVTGHSADGAITFMRCVKLGDEATLALADDDPPTPPAAPMAPTVAPAREAYPQGTFTVVFGSDRRTVRIETVREKDNQFDGWTFAKYLNGPENTRNYRNFAYARPGQALTMKRGFDPDSLIAKALAALLTADPEAQHAMGVTWARESGNCYVCSRTLTTPESIEAGIGPVCAGK